MVGHLGTPELAALALAGTLLTGAFTLFNFLTYGTTAARRAPARGRGGGGGRQDRGAGALAVHGHRRRAHGRARRAGRAARGAARRRGADGRPRHHVPADRLAGAPVRADRARRAGLAARGVGPADAARDRGGGQRRERAAEPAVHLRVRLGPRRVGVGHGRVAGRDGRGVRAAPPASARARPAREPRGDAPARAHRGRDLRPHRGALRVVPRGERGAGADGRGLAGRAPDRVPAVRVPGAGARLGRDRRAGDRGPRAGGRATPRERAAPRAG